MNKFKNIRIKMKGGKSRLQRVKVLASGKFKFVKNLTKRRTSRTRKVNPTRRKGVRKMARRKRRRGGKSLTQQAFKWIRIGALVGGGAMEAMKYSEPQDKIIAGVLSYAGVNYSFPRFEWDLLARTWAPYLAATLATHGIPKIAGILRRL